MKRQEQIGWWWWIICASSKIENQPCLVLHCIKVIHTTIVQLSVHIVAFDFDLLFGYRAVCGVCVCVCVGGGQFRPSPPLSPLALSAETSQTGRLGDDAWPRQCSLPVSSLFIADLPDKIFLPIPSKLAILNQFCHRKLAKTG